MSGISITALSDMHGFLPRLKKKCNLICVCGDIFPLNNIDRNIEESKRWFYEIFLNWILELPCEFVIMIPGNHCLYLEHEYKMHGRILLPNGFNNKCVCLVDDSYYYKGLHFYGTPWVTNLPRWAFNTDNPQSKFEKIPYECDILLTHHAPDFGKLGCSFPNTDNEKNYGSLELAKVILARPNIKYHFCGHIHTGVHGGVKIGNTISYNVSILDELYHITYPETHINIC